MSDSLLCYIAWYTGDFYSNLLTMVKSVMQIFFWVKKTISKEMNDDLNLHGITITLVPSEVPKITRI